MTMAGITLRQPCFTLGVRVGEHAVAPKWSAGGRSAGP
nr:hypothetical protein [Kibdelosporangium sp. MJ126-NF4]CTQ93597.1 hypothetical protein [Kibdelosporangium sp. MJ126-NF4]